jgi:hypothetical protein
VFIFSFDAKKPKDQRIHTKHHQYGKIGTSHRHHQLQQVESSFGHIKMVHFKAAAVSLFLLGATAA